MGEWGDAPTMPAFGRSSLGERPAGRREEQQPDSASHIYRRMRQRFIQAHRRPLRITTVNRFRNSEWQEVDRCANMATLLAEARVRTMRLLYGRYL
jgi:hypothetical protein